MSPKILVANAMAWPAASRLARAFLDVGCEVATLTPEDHPVYKSDFVSQRLVYDPLRPVRSVLAAIGHAKPDLIVPCDDRLVDRLRWVWRHGPEAASALVERSLGPGVARGDARSRLALSGFRAMPGVRTPATAPIRRLAEIEAVLQHVGLPLVLKLDNAWGGLHVVKITARERVLPTVLGMRARHSWPMRFKRALLRGEIEALRDGPQTIVAQSFVSGRTANLALACWRGAIQAVVPVEAIQTRGVHGISTVVRVRDDSAMLAVAKPIAERLQLSGLHGFDFIIDETGAAHLIEINQRATQTSHMPLGPGRDLAEALRAAFCDEEPRQIRRAIPAREIALFPQEWMRDPASRWLWRAYHDVPENDAGFVAHCGYDVMRRPALRFNMPRRTASGGR